MHLWSATRLPTAAVAWRGADGALAITAIGKATFRLEPGTSRLAPVQEPIATQDVSDATGGAVHVPGDVVPLKARAEVLVVGAAGASRPRLLLGSIDKTFDVARGRVLGGGTSMAVRVAGVPGARPDQPWFERPVPGDVHPSTWNAAPLDQRLDALPDPVAFVLDGVGPQPLATTLEAVRFSLWGDGAGGGVAGSHPLRADTLWLDLDRGIACVTYRALVRVEVAEQLRATILTDPPPPGDPVPITILGGDAAAAPPDGDELSAQTFLDVSALLPQTGTPSALPFRPPPKPLPPPAASRTELPAPAFAAAPQTPRPALVHDSGAALVGGVAGASDAAAGASAARARRARRSGRTGLRPPPASSDLCDLIWFDPLLPERVRRIDAWAPAVSDDGDRPFLTFAESVEDARASKDRRTITRALARVTPAELSTLPRLLAESVDDDGFVERPLLVVAGEVSVPLDPADELKETVALASALAPLEKIPVKLAAERLREALEAAADAGPGQRAAIDVSLKRIRQAFAQATRAFPPDYLETTVQQTLREERKHQVREVFGAPHLVARIQPGTGVATPLYLPAEIVDRLPVAPRFRARLVTEPHPQQHGGDGEGAVLRVLAFGRVLAQRPRVAS